MKCNQMVRMTEIRSKIKSLGQMFNIQTLMNSKPAHNLSQPGLYHFTRQKRFERSRIHLRIDPDSSGLLLVNASRVMHLNPTAALMAHLLLEQTDEAETIRSIQRAYRVDAERARVDLADFRNIDGDLRKLYQSRDL